jgi:elongation factor Ts
MAITAADVSKLRKMTGAGMMDCKKALTEADGDFEKAIEVIRKKGQAVANKRADREAKEGVVLAKVSADGKNGGLVVLNCETDFVAKNESFIALTESILDLALQNNASSLSDLNEMELNGVKIKDVVTEQVGVIGEKLELSAFECITSEKTIAYIHPGNKLATLVGFNLADIDDQIAKDIAMQVAAMNPVSVDSDSVDKATIEKELEIGKEMARNEGKPEAMLDKIAEGRLNKFFKESTLLNQAFVKDNKLSIKQYLQQANKDLTVTGFRRYSLNN